MEATRREAILNSVSVGRASRPPYFSVLRAGSNSIRSRRPSDESGGLASRWATSGQDPASLRWGSPPINPRVLLSQRATGSALGRAPFMVSLTPREGSMEEKYADACSLALSRDEGEQQI